MKDNILKYLRGFVIKIVLPLVILFVLSISILLLKPSDIFVNYAIPGLTYLGLNYYLAVIFLFAGKSKTNKGTLYSWLDNLDGNDKVFRDLFLSIKSHKEILVNLDIVYKKINIYTNYKVKNMKLLKAYFNTLDTENTIELMRKTVLSIIIALVIWGINKGSFWEFSKTDGTLFEVHPNYLTILNYVTLIFELVLFLGVFIKDFFDGKRRNKIVLEIIDVCIDEMK